tara:strand:- start:3489 stop:4550 length:1062 start_codon:yes stop_codon:yes gene_type:complete
MAESSQPTQAQINLTYDRDNTKAPYIYSKITPAKPTIVFDSYWRFAAERQKIFFGRINGKQPPWTSDPILKKHKFTNAYRASDRVSQYLIKHVIYESEQKANELFFRIILFKFFNRIETWKLLQSELGTLSFSKFSFKRYDEILTKAIDDGKRLYSAAYIMPTGGPSTSFGRKHRMHLKLLEKMMQDEVPSRLENMPSMSKAFELLRSYPTIGDFLAYQYVTDLNYSTLTNFSEMEFVKPGPGAIDGIRKCFTDLGGLSESEIIKLMAERQEVEFERLELDFKSLWGRPLQLIDCQNLFCETDKYARVKHPEFAGVKGRTKIKQKYQITKEPINYLYPPKWGLNDLVKKGEHT